MLFNSYFDCFLFFLEKLRRWSLLLVCYHNIQTTWVAYLCCYLCMVSDVKTNVFTVADVTVLNCGTSTLAADTDSGPHWNKQRRDLLVHRYLCQYTYQNVHGKRRRIQSIGQGSLPVHVLRMMQWSMMGLQLTVISKQWCALWCWADLSSGLNCSGHDIRQRQL